MKHKYNLLDYSCQYSAGTMFQVCNTGRNEGKRDTPLPCIIFIIRQGLGNIKCEYFMIKRE